MSYILRNDQNVLVAELPDSIAFQMIDTFKGNNIIKNFVSGNKACYIFDTKGSVLVQDTVRLYVLNGYFLTKKESD